MPTYVSVVETPGFVNDAAASDTFLFIADDSTGVVAASVARPLFPYVIDTYNNSGVARGVFATPPFVYLADSDSLITLMLADINAVDDDFVTPFMFDLKGTYPNPFNSEAQVEFSLTHRLWMSLDIYDVSGRHMARPASGLYEPGNYTISWDASMLPSGVYLVRLCSGNVYKSVKAVLLK
jgi:hypothetical protein